MYFLIFLVAINLFKLVAAPFFPLIGDEAYYWLWWQHLDLSYVDHPPMIAYVNLTSSPCCSARTKWPSALARSGSFC